MRRFSQRQSLVTLSDINITPLLDLAFVLLIIFVITTPLLEQGINLNLPKADSSEDNSKIQKTDVRTIDVHPSGWYYAGNSWRNLDQVTAAVSQEYRGNPKLLVYVRADETTPWKFVAELLGRLERLGVERVSVRTKPVK